MKPKIDAFLQQEIEMCVSFQDTQKTILALAEEAG